MQEEMSVKMKNRKKHNLCNIAVICIVCVAIILSGILKQNIIVNAAETKTYSITMTGSYRDPSTQQIQDSGGESSEALGQSMVNSVVDGTGLLELDASGNWVMSIRFHLMDNISNVTLSTQLPGDSVWNNASYEVTGKTTESKDLRLSIPGENAVIKAECYVEAMGRSVIFFVTYSNPVEGNTGNFMTLVSDNKGETSVNSKVNMAETKDSTSDEISNTTSDLLSGVDGLTIGKNEQSTADQMETNSNQVQVSREQTGDNLTFQTNMGELKLNIDDSFWRVLFGILFCAVFFADMVFGLGYYLVKKLVKSKTPHKVDFDSHEKKFEEEDIEDDVSFQFMDDQEDLADAE